MIYRLKSDPSQTVDALELKNAITFTGPGPFPAGHQIGVPGDFLATTADGSQKILHRGEFEAYEPDAQTGENPAPKTKKAKGEAAA